MSTLNNKANFAIAINNENYINLFKYIQYNSDKSKVFPH